jgi:sugar-specific transcriptional regulator TrmB
MSLNRIYEVLISLGLSQTDARIYIFLASKGSKKARQIIQDLEINKQQLYRSLKRLRNKKIIYTSVGTPALFIAEPFDKTIRMLMNNKKKQAKVIEEKKTDLLSLWDSFDLENNNT